MNFDFISTKKKKKRIEIVHNEMEKLIIHQHYNYHNKKTKVTTNLTFNLN